MNAGRVQQGLFPRMLNNAAIHPPAPKYPANWLEIAVIQRRWQENLLTSLYFLRSRSPAQPLQNALPPARFKPHLQIFCHPPRFFCHRYVDMISSAMTEHPDIKLVFAIRAGDRNAFGKIIERYQSLVCSVAYSATGNLSLSEDVAQETFVAAWKQLNQLHEPEKLGAWLGGIARNITRNTLRRLGRDPVQNAETLEAACELTTPDKSPTEHTMSREEEAILWRSIERIPENYRE